MSAEIEVIVRVSLGSTTTEIRKTIDVHPKLIATSLPVTAEHTARLLASQYAPDTPPADERGACTEDTPKVKFQGLNNWRYWNK